MFPVNTRPATEISRSNANSQQSAISAWHLSLSVAISLMLAACGGANDNSFGDGSTAVSATAGEVAGTETKQVSNTVAPATVYGVSNRPTITAFNVVQVQADAGASVFDFSISGQQRSSGGYQSWTNQPWAKVSYLGSTGQYRLTIDNSQWSANETERTLTLVANNDAGQTLLTVKVQVTQPSIVSTPAVQSASSVTGINGRPSITSSGLFVVRRDSSANHFDFTITGPQRQAGGHQAWTDQLWARVSYLGQLGQYRVTVDTTGWDENETSRSFKLVANNDAGQTTLLLNPTVAGAAPTAAPAPAPAVTPPTPTTQTTPTAQPDDQTTVTVAGVNGRPTLTSHPTLTVAPGQSSATLNYSITGPQHSFGGYQSWTDQSWATVSYAGELGKYRLTADLSRWGASESSRTFKLIANNSAGQTSLSVSVTRAAAPTVVASPTVAPPSAPTPAPAPTPVAQPSESIAYEPDMGQTISPDQPLEFTGPKPNLLANADTSNVELAINSVEEIIGDMSLGNDAKLLGIPDFQWAVNPVAGQVAMGADPRGCFAPQWWKNIARVPADFKDCDYWTGYVQWFIIFEGEGNAANNVRVETRKAETWYLSKSTGQWKLLGESEGSLWYRATKVNVTWVPGGVDMIRTDAGSTALRVDRASPYTYHGQWDLDKIEIGHVASDIQAIYATVQARLVVDNPNLPDDRNNAVWLLHNGADYYPAVDTDPFVSIPPGIGLSRSKKITSEWQSFNFANLSTARQDYTGPIPPLTPDQLRNNPPPMK